jgi:hypothetical protein
MIYEQVPRAWSTGDLLTADNPEPPAHDRSLFLPDDFQRRGVAARALTHCIPDACVCNRTHVMPCAVVNDLQCLLIHPNHVLSLYMKAWIPSIHRRVADFTCMNPTGVGKVCLT